jgi:hypothetical protein
MRDLKLPVMTVVAFRKVHGSRGGLDDMNSNFVVSNSFVSALRHSMDRLVRDAPGWNHLVNPHGNRCLGNEDKIEGWHLSKAPRVPRRPAAFSYCIDSSRFGPRRRAESLPAPEKPTT